MTDVKQEAKSRNIRWTEIKRVASELRQLARQEREWEWSLRRRVWEFYAYTRDSLPFWRHGMKSRFRRAFEDGDMTLIPRFDDVAQSIACEFPELSNKDDISQWLFEFLREPHNTLPSLESFYAQALELCSDETTAVPF